jgi:hypothetical protein
VKSLRKQANFIESLGSQWPYHIEVHWTSLEAVLSWWRKNQDEVTAHCLMEDKEIADDIEWWLELINELKSLVIRMPTRVVPTPVVPTRVVLT